jgi:Cof subfamily protein (haloacid dehalogenase superfamily)
MDFKKGIIALDIDGTITAEHHTISPDVVAFFRRLSSEGWTFIFITGRTFRWGYEVLQYLSIPYYLAVQNGAIILDMPIRRVVAKKYLDRTIIPVMDEICKEELTDFVIYTGYEHQDQCYFRSNKFSPLMQKYLNERTTALKEVWIALDSFSQMNIQQFPSVKCFGFTNESALSIANKMESRLHLHVPVIRDPFDNRYFVAQGTHKDADKGHTLKNFAELISNEGIIIAAGDDHNDRGMLEASDIAVAMSTSPQAILDLADIIAPPADKDGIIAGLQDAIKLAEARNLYE